MELMLLSLFTVIVCAVYFVAKKFAMKDARNGKSQRENLPSRRRPFDRLPPNPESFLTTPEVLRSRGYPAETHRVTTEDGYIIELHRIPAKTKGSRAVFIQHGFCCSSGCWVINPASRSLPCLLSDSGYDVWLGNFRGNVYSRAHAHLDTKGSEYWKFAGHHLGKYDMPPIINYVLSVTDQPKLSAYIGHSMGGISFYVAMAEHPELNEKIDIMIGLAPLTSLTYTESLLTRHILPIAFGFFKPVTQLLLSARKPLGDLQGSTSRRFLRFMTEKTYFQAHFWMKLFSLTCFRLNFTNLDLDLVPMINSTVFCGSSMDTFIHAAQFSIYGKLMPAFDYGPEGNLQHYGTTYPVQYDLGKVKAPTYIFYGSKDDAITPKDVQTMLDHLGNLKYSECIPGYAHLDFLFGNDVKEKCYDKVMSLLPPP